MRLVLLADLRVETLLRGPLGDAGFEVETVRSPEALIDECAAAPTPAVVIVSLPASLPTADFLKSFRSGTGAAGPPIILILPPGAEVDIPMLAEAGVVDICVAPFQGARLVRRIKDIAAGKRTQPPPPRTEITATPLVRPPILPPEATPGNVTGTPSPRPAEETSSDKSPASAGPEEATPDKKISELLEVDIELPSLPGKQIDLSGIAEAPNPPPEQKRERREPTAPPPPRSEAATPGAKTAGSGPIRWPDGLPTIEACVSLLIAQTMNALLPEGTDEPTLSATWKSLTTAEVGALRSVADRESDLSKTEDPAVALARLAATQLRLRTAIVQAEQLLADRTKARVNEDQLTQWKQQIDRDVREVLDPILQKAVEQGDLLRMKDYRIVRESLSLRRGELDRVAAKLRGVTQEKVTAALLDRDAAPTNQETARKTKGAVQARLLEISTVTVQRVKDNARTLIVIASVLGVISLALHVLVFDTFHLKNRPQQVDRAPKILGVDRIAFYGTTARVSVNDAFNRQRGLRELAHQVPPGTLVIVENASGYPVATLQPDVVRDLAAVSVDDTKVKLPPEIPYPGHTVSAEQ
jgi:DNA-binding response OmpR family regulator